MKYYSEKLDKVFDTPTELDKAENEYLAKKHAEAKAKAAQEAAKAEASNKRATRAKDVEEALKAKKEAYKVYVQARNTAYEQYARVASNADKKLNDFCRDYGYFHFSIDADEAKESLHGLFGDFFDNIL